jgi:hypothetical protein
MAAFLLPAIRSRMHVSLPARAADKKLSLGSARLSSAAAFRAFRAAVRNPWVKIAGSTETFGIQP